jgi:2'-hydroxyisoflavone reductase
VGCEKAVQSAIPTRALILRAGLLVGPHDPTDRFTYWPRRVALGGDVLVPGKPGASVQIIDARDLADWILRAVESRITGVYNATGPREPLTMREVLQTCQAQTGSSAQFTWIDDRFLLSSGVKPRMEIPLWIPGAPGAATVDCRRAIAAGLVFRPLADTVRDTLAWDSTRSTGGLPRAGIAPEREAQLLQAWNEFTSSRTVRTSSE